MVKKFSSYNNGPTHQGNTWRRCTPEGKGIFWWIKYQENIPLTQYAYIGHSTTNSSYDDYAPLVDNASHASPALFGAE
jgi:hypothetical protein